jgi:hypothetical protein
MHVKLIQLYIRGRTLSQAKEHRAVKDHIWNVKVEHYQSLVQAGTLF